MEREEQDAVAPGTGRGAEVVAGDAQRDEPLLLVEGGDGDLEAAVGGAGASRGVERKVTPSGWPISSSLTLGEQQGQQDQGGEQERGGRA